MTMPAQTMVWHCEHCGGEVEGDFQAMRWAHLRNGCGKLIQEPIALSTIHRRQVPSPLSEMDLVEVLAFENAVLRNDLEQAFDMSRDVANRVVDLWYWAENNSTDCDDVMEWCAETGRLIRNWGE